MTQAAKLPGVAPSKSPAKSGTRAKSADKAEGGRNFSVSGFRNNKVTEAAHRGDLQEAESYMAMLLDGAGVPYVKAFNALLEALAQKGEIEKADAWFIKAFTPALYPGAASLELDAESYNVMVQAFAGHGDMARAEKYAREAESLNFPLNLASYMQLAKTFCANGEIRRAHRWCKHGVSHGVKKFQKQFMNELVRALADQGNHEAAVEWLGFMADMHLRLDESTYDHVRSLHPGEQIPAQLSGEFGKPGKPACKPPALRGEEIIEAEKVHRASLKAALPGSEGPSKASSPRQRAIAAKDSVRRRRAKSAQQVACLPTLSPRPGVDGSQTARSVDAGVQTDL
eukprot:gnl/TRDRNA2_/TRDRNA2_29812_c0_seq1.p1 gnl/TRDRNA2_/TRDRNA2_29812_c0~~gnl/TRDRNA2_/TRDRNA2_29812_c0_seq1.p1  ORF type:complete len:341 (+),score=78.31 gnl/TRDRNA2_/TRDRNA2_29812_c0_seq1:103-1125(+)